MWLAIFIVGFLLMVMGIISKHGEKKRRSRNEATRRRMQEEAERRAGRLREAAIAELMKQARSHGDTDTLRLCEEGKYGGELPRLLPDFTWSNAYSVRMVFTVAAIRSKKSRSIYNDGGWSKAKLVPEPDTKAIRVITTDGGCIGYVPTELTDEVLGFTGGALPYPALVEIDVDTDCDTGRRNFWGIATITKDCPKIPDHSEHMLYV